MTNSNMYRISQVEDNISNNQKEVEELRKRVEMLETLMSTAPISQNLESLQDSLDTEKEDESTTELLIPLSVRLYSPLFSLLKKHCCNALNCFLFYLF